jgi:hypothetical protein
MRTWMKVAGGLVLTLALALAGLAFFIKVKFPPEKIKTLVLDAAKKNLHRELRLEKVSVGLWRGLSLEGVALSETPDFKAGTFLSADRLSVTPSLKPLLRGKLAVKSVSLEGPAVSVVRFRDGRFNFSDLAASTGAVSTAGPDGPPSAAPALAFLVDQFSLRRGSLSFEDRGEGLSVKMSDLSLTVSGLSPSAAFPMALSGAIDVSSGSKKLASLSLDIRSRLSPTGEGRADIEDLSLSWDGASIDLKGLVQRWQDPLVDLSVTLKTFRAKTLAPFIALPAELADTTVSGVVALKGHQKEFLLDGELQAAAPGASLDAGITASMKNPNGTPAFKTEAKLQRLSVEKSPWAPALALKGPVEGRLSADGSARALRIQFGLSAPGAEFRWGEALSKPAGAALWVKGEADLPAPFDDPVFKMEGRAERITLAPKPPLPADPAAAGPVTLSFSAQGRMNDVAAVIEADGREAALSYAALFRKPAGTPFSAKMDGRLTGLKDLSLRSASLLLGPIVAGMEGTIQDMPGKGRMDLTIKAAPFDVAPFGRMVPSLQELALSGRAGIQTAVKGSFSSPQAKGTLTLAGFGAMPMKGISFDNLTGTLAFTQDAAETTGIKGRFNGEPLTVSFKAKNAGNPELEMEGSLAALDLGKLMAVFAGTATTTASSPAAPRASAAAPPLLTKTAGHFRIGTVTHPSYVGKNFSLTWNLANVGTDFSRLNGTAQLTAADGKIHNLPLADKINNLLGKNAADITYSRMGGSFQITRGVLNTQDFAIDSSQADIAARGTVNLADTTADMRAVFRLPAGSVGGSAEEWFADADGRPTVEATIKGLLSDPTIRPDLSKAAKRAVETLLKDPQKIIDSLFKKKKR